MTSIRVLVRFLPWAIAAAASGLPAAHAQSQSTDGLNAQSLDLLQRQTSDGTRIAGRLSRAFWRESLELAESSLAPASDGGAWRNDQADAEPPAIELTLEEQQLLARDLETVDRIFATTPFLEGEALELRMKAIAIEAREAKLALLTLDAAVTRSLGEGTSPTLAEQATLDHAHDRLYRAFVAAIAQSHRSTSPATLREYESNRENAILAGVIGGLLVGALTAILLGHLGVPLAASLSAFASLWGGLILMAALAVNLSGKSVPREAEAAKNRAMSLFTTEFNRGSAQPFSFEDWATLPESYAATIRSFGLGCPAPLLSFESVARKALP